MSLFLPTVFLPDRDLDLGSLWDYLLLVNRKGINSTQVRIFKTENSKIGTESALYLNNRSS
jgi:hypothetical protein